MRASRSSFAHSSESRRFLRAASGTNNSSTLILPTALCAPAGGPSSTLLTRSCSSFDSGVMTSVRISRSAANSSHCAKSCSVGTTTACRLLPASAAMPSANRVCPPSASTYPRPATTPSAPDSGSRPPRRASSYACVHAPGRGVGSGSLRNFLPLRNSQIAVASANSDCKTSMGGSLSDTNFSRTPLTAAVAFLCSAFMRVCVFFVVSRSFWILFIASSTSANATLFFCTSKCG
eukprot:169238-Rhodomonas_salina.5